MSGTDLRPFKTSVFLTLLLFFPLLTQAQEGNGFNAVGAKVLFIDYGNPNLIKDLDITNGLEISYIRGINKFMNLSFPLKVGVANVNDDINNRNITSLDAILQFQYQKDEKTWLIPYFFAGGGLVYERSGDANTQIPIGAGINFKVGKNSYINTQGEYRISNLENRDNLQIGLGYIYRFGNTDKDGDGVVDGRDKCPEIPGIAAFEGCPDTDQDGIADAEDVCPLVAGLKEMNGCPDTDGDGLTDADDPCPRMAGRLNGCPDSDNDGIADSEDECPDVVGTKAMQGCPDRDSDGIADYKDKCPDEYGTLDNDGCPVVVDSDNDGFPDAQDQCPNQPGTIGGCPDTDGDGVIDSKDRCPELAGPFSGCPDTDGDGLMNAEDRCPNQAGPADNQGCPVITEEVKQTLNIATQAVRFETGRATLKTSSYEVLDRVVQIMNQYVDHNLTISGHTDNVGEAQNNQILSEDRAKACFQYLVTRGIAPSRMGYVGYGESRPLADNNSAQGRVLNRRVEFNLYVR